MLPIHKLTALALILCPLLAAPTASWGQAASSAAAKTTSRSSSTPSTYAVKQHFLSFQQARIQSEIREVRRCIANASNTQVVRDPEGNLNRTPQIDLTTCSRRLQQLTRQLTELVRSADQLTKDAEMAGIKLESLARETLRQNRMKSSNPFSSSNSGM